VSRLKVARKEDPGANTEREPGGEIKGTGIRTTDRMKSRNDEDLTNVENKPGV